MRRRVHVLAMLVSGLLIGGCGSSKSTTPSTNAGISPQVQLYEAAKAHFIAEAEPICRAAIRQLAPLVRLTGSLARLPPASQARALVRIREEVTSAEAEIGKLEPLSEPSRDTRAISAWIVALRKDAAAISEFTNSVEEQGLGRSRAAYDAILRARTHSHSLAAAYGFKYCSKLD